jgi:hypothetical protein
MGTISRSAQSEFCVSQNPFSGEYSTRDQMTLGQSKADGLGEHLLLRSLTWRRALSHQPFLLGCTYLLAEVGFNKVNGLENQLRTAREPLLARCDNASA